MHIELRSVADLPQRQAANLPPINRALALAVLLVAAILVIVGAVKLALLA